MLGYPVALPLGHSGHAVALGQILPDEPVGVLVGPTFPTVVRCRKIELHPAYGFDLCIPVELRPVVRRDGPHPPGMPRHQFQHGAIGFGGRPRSQFADEHVASFALHQRQDAVAALPEAFAHDRVDLPMPAPFPALHRRRPLADPPLPGQPSSAVVAPVTLPALLAGSSQMQMQGAPGLQIPPHVPVNRLVADRQLPGPPKVPGHLLGTPFLLQQFFDPSEFRAPKLAVAPRPLPPRHRSLLRPPSPIPPVMRRGVSPQFTPHRAPVPAKFPGDRRLAQPHPPQGRQRAPFFCIELPVVHPHLPARLPHLS